MINNINNKLAFCFMFYFIACTFAGPESNFKKCLSQMEKANLLMVINNSVIVDPKWQRTVDEALVPLCKHVQRYEENRKNKTEDNKVIEAIEGDKGEVKSEGQGDKGEVKSEGQGDKAIGAGLTEAATKRLQGLQAIGGDKAIGAGLTEAATKRLQGNNARKAKEGEYTTEVKEAKEAIEAKEAKEAIGAKEVNEAKEKNYKQSEKTWISKNGGSVHIAKETPTCTLLNYHKKGETKYHTAKEGDKELENILKDFLLVCDNLSKYQKNQLDVDKAFQPILNNLFPTCSVLNNYFDSQAKKAIEGDKGEVKSEGQGDKNLFEDILSICGILSRYEENKTNDNKAFQPILNNILPTCSVLNDYYDSQGFKYKQLKDLSSTCTLLLTYRKTGVKKYHSEYLYSVDDFFPICTFVMNHHEKNNKKPEDNPQNPKQFCNKFIEE